MAIIRKVGRQHIYSRQVEPDMVENRGLILGCATSLFLLAFLTLYLRAFPIIIDEETSDGLFLAILLFLVVTLCVMTFSVRRPRDSIFVLIPMGIFSIVARAVPHLRLSYPPLLDPYFHYSSTRMLIETERLQVSNIWYEQASFQLYWPDMHILTFDLHQIAGIDLWTLFRFQEPLMGVVFLFAVYLFAKAIVPRENVALLAAFIASFSDVIIFYQSEYHPQGFALTLFVLLLALYLRSRERSTAPFALLSLIVLAAMVLSHHFSSLFLALLGLVVATLDIIILRLKWFEFLQFDRGAMVRDVNTMLLIGVAALSYHVFVFIEPMKQFIRLLGMNVALVATSSNFSLNGDFMSTPPSLTFFNSIKWLILAVALAFIALYFMKKMRNRSVDRVTVILTIILAAGAGGLLFPNAPLDRLLAFAMPLLAPFAALALLSLANVRQAANLKGWKVFSFFVALMISVGAISIGVLNAPNTPSYYFHDSPPNQNYWYSNVLPEMDQYKYAGTWAQDQINDTSYVGTSFDTRIILFYFGEKRYVFTSTNPHDYQHLSYVLVNPDIPYSPNDDRGERFDRDLNPIYLNGEVKLYAVPSQ